MIEPYFVNVDQEILDDLNLRIKNSRWPIMVPIYLT